MKSSKELEPEKRVEHYEWSFKEHLGSGSFAKVYKGRDRNTNEIVAIKIMDSSLMNDEYMKSTLQNEVKILKSLTSPNIVRLLDVYMTKNNVYIMQEFCKDGDLRHFMKERKGKAISEEEANLILRNIIIGMRALAAKKIVHRDLKPENIMINDMVFKIGDFGFARAIDDPSSMLTSIVGTPLYMSPQILQNLNYTSKGDVWSLGIIYYEVLFGRTPWPARTQYELINKTINDPLRYPHNVTVSEASKNFIKKCLEISENSRYSWDEAFHDPLVEDFQTSVIRSHKRETISFNLDDQCIQIISKIQYEITRRKLDLDKLFKKLDMSGDNTLDVKEFSRLVKHVSDGPVTDILIEHVFKRCDVDSSGTISLEEFKRLINEKDYTSYQMYQDPNLKQKAERILRRLREIVLRQSVNIEKLFKSYDNSKDNLLDNDELKNMLEQIDKEITTKEVEYIFEQIDENKDKNISFEEFKKIFDQGNTNQKIKKLSIQSEKALDNLVRLVKEHNIDTNFIFKKYDSGTNHLGISQFKNLITKIDENLSEKEVEELFKNIDSDGNGTIEFDEFRSLFGN